MVWVDYDTNDNLATICRQMTNIFVVTNFGQKLDKTKTNRTQFVDKL